MAANLVDITNISIQTVPILIDAIALANVSANSDIGSTRAEQMAIPPGSEVTIEMSRVDIGQLEQLQRLGLLTFTSR